MFGYVSVSGHCYSSDGDTDDDDSSRCSDYKDSDLSDYVGHTDECCCERPLKRRKLNQTRLKKYFQVENTRSFKVNSSKNEVDELELVDKSMLDYMCGSLTEAVKNGNSVKFQNILDVYKKLDILHEFDKCKLLSLAVSNGHLFIVEKLMKYGAFLLYGPHRRCFMTAVKYGYTDVIRYVLENSPCDIVSCVDSNEKNPLIQCQSSKSADVISEFCLV